MSSVPFSVMSSVPFSVMPGDSFLCNAERFLPLSCLQFSCQIRMYRAVPFSLSCRAITPHCHAERSLLTVMSSESPLLSNRVIPFSLSYLSNVTPLSYMGITPLCHVERAERVETSAQRVRNPACFTNLQLLCIFSIRILFSAVYD